MTAKTFSNALGEINTKYVSEAINYSAAKKKNVWLKWGAIAACFVLVVAAVIRISIGFIPSQMTDIYREGIGIELADLSGLPVEYNGVLLAENLDFTDSAAIELYYNENGTAQNVSDWYSLLISDGTSDYDLMMFCMFGEASVEDWKVDMVFTDEATETININGVDVQIARWDMSLQYEYWYYAIFEYDGVVYDIRTKSNNASFIYDILNTVLQNK